MLRSFASDWRSLYPRFDVSRRAVTILVALLVGPRVAGAEALTLDASLARAREANGELAAARADLAAARGRLSQASVLAANPVVTSGATHHRIPGETNVDAAVSLGQELQVGGQRGLRIAAARFDVEHAEALGSDHERLVAGEVRRAFAGLVAARRRQVIAAEAAAQSRRLAGIAATRFAQGDTGRLDADLARLDQTKAEADAAAAVTEVERAEARLATALGAGSDETFALVAPSDEPAHPTPVEADAVDRALATRPDLRAARADRARLDGEADLTHRAGSIPNPTVRGFYSHENGSESLVGGEIEVPLPIFDRQRGAELDLRGQAASVAATVMRLERQIPRDVHLAIAHHRTAEATWARRRRDASVAPSVRESLERALSAGLMGLPDVLVQQDRLREARKADVDAWLDLREAEAEVIEAIGDSPW